MKSRSPYIVDILETSTKDLVLVVEDRTGTKHHINCLLDEYNKYANGELIQKAFPNMSLANRELIISGYTEEMWDQLMMYEDDDIGCNTDNYF